MPGSKVHFAWEAALFPLSLLGVILLSLRIKSFPPTAGFYSAYSGAYFFSSRFLSPDLDMKSSACRKRWGIFSPIWIPYSLLFKHRKISHNPFLGPLTRMIYLAILLALLTTVGTGSFDLPGLLSRIKPHWYLAVLTGIYLPNLIHILVDILD